MKKILITGAAGFIGCPLALSLAGSGDHVTVAIDWRRPVFEISTAVK
jgi:nucleoside-diphosphate-sugar epimerase